MKNAGKTIERFFLLSLVLLVYQKPAISQEVGSHVEFSYQIGSTRGPDQWGNLKEGWEDCRDGNEQSPIDLSSGHTQTVPNSGNLLINYKPSNATLKNKDHAIELQWLGDAGSISINGEDFSLKECHWHSPSEHTVNGTRFALEQHLVHERIDPILGERVAVFGIMYDIGQPQEFLSELEEAITSISGDGQNQLNVGTVTPPHIEISNEGYYRYLGSLTTPPCTEGVIWIVDNLVKSVSLQQVELLRSAVHESAENNARPLQPDNGRDIFLHKSGLH